MLRACRSLQYSPSPAAGTARCTPRYVWWCDEALDDFDHWRPADGRRAQLDELRSVAIEARSGSSPRGGPSERLDPRSRSLRRRRAVARAPLGAVAHGLSTRRLRRRRLASLRAGPTHPGGRPRGVARARARRAAYESLLREESGSTGAPRSGRSRSFALVSLADEQTADALAARSQGDDARAVRASWLRPLRPEMRKTFVGSPKPRSVRPETDGVQASMRPMTSSRCWTRRSTMCRRGRRSSGRVCFAVGSGVQPPQAGGRVRGCGDQGSRDRSAVDDQRR